MMLPLDDAIGCLRQSIPKLSRSSLHQYLQRHGIWRLPVSDIKTAAKRKFALTEISYVHIDIAELRLAPGKLNVFWLLTRCQSSLAWDFRTTWERSMVQISCVACLTLFLHAEFKAQGRTLPRNAKHSAASILLLKQYQSRFGPELVLG